MMRFSGAEPAWSVVPSLRFVHRPSLIWLSQLARLLFGPIFCSRCQEHVRSEPLSATNGSPYMARQLDIVPCLVQVISLSK
jgi:hypothetical protein